MPVKAPGLAEKLTARLTTDLLTKLDTCDMRANRPQRPDTKTKDGQGTFETPPRFMLQAISSV